MKLFASLCGRWEGLVLTGLAAFVAFKSPEARALNPDRSIFQYNCQTWRRQNGLIANGVNSITQTKDGYVWLGTAVGLVRFDGTDFKLLDMNNVPEVRSTIVSDMCAAKDGGLWFGMEQGAFGYCDGKNIFLKSRDDWGGPNLSVHAIEELPNGDVWLAAEILAGFIRSNELETVLSTATPEERYNVMSLFRDSKGRIWLGTAARGLFYWTDGKLEKLADPNLDRVVVRSFAEDHEGNLWVGTEWGLLCFDSELKRKEFQYPWYPTRALLVDRNGLLWIGTAGGGLYRSYKGELSQFRQVDGLADDMITALAEDDEGNIWVGTRNGLSQLSDVKLPTMSKSEGLTADINVAVCASRNGGIWVATSQGFTYFDGWGRNYTNGLNNTYINSIFEARNGDVYLVNGSMEVQVFSGEKIVATYPNKTWPSAFTEDSKSVLVSVGSELYRIGTNLFEPYVFTNGTNPFNWIFSLNPSADGGIWAAGDGG